MDNVNLVNCDRWHWIASKLAGGGISVWDEVALMKEANKLVRGNKYVEIGVLGGHSFLTVYVAAPNGVYCHGIDSVDNPTRKSNFDLCEPDYVTFEESDSVEAGLKYQLTGKKDVNLIFIDGNHNYEAVKKDIEAWYPNMAPGGVMLFHDYSAPFVNDVIKAVDEFAASINKKIEEFHASAVVKIQL